MNAPAEYRVDTRALQARFDAEGAAIAAAPLRIGAPTVVESWKGLWEEAPAADRRDLGCLVCMASAILTVFTALWIMLPA